VKASKRRESASRRAVVRIVDGADSTEIVTSAGRSFLLTWVSHYPWEWYAESAGDRPPHLYSLSCLGREVLRFCAAGDGLASAIDVAVEIAVRLVECGAVDD
jgi:hypothetical protein